MKIELGCSELREPMVSLGNLEAGDFFRFSHVSEEEAIKEELFYIVVNAPEKDRIMIVNPSNGERLVRDKEHRVIKHKVKLTIWNTEWVE